ncbi:MAG: hypothetical protein LBN06_06925 [Prevotellaceae bacterium]|nr:hypothetical protein [Prevotellaceae bacterium]
MGKRFLRSWERDSYGRGKEVPMRTMSTAIRSARMAVLARAAGYALGDLYLFARAMVITERQVWFALGKLLRQYDAPTRTITEWRVD